MTHLSAFAEMRTDPLTGVANRRAFDDQLQRMLSTHQDSQEPPLGVAMLDLDHFKLVNDRQGHLAGDRILQELTQLLKPALREGDMLARFGGEEFVVLMPRTPLRSACSLAERLRQRVEEKLDTTVSIGVAANIPGETSTDLLSRADAALYTAKQEGRNLVSLHEGIEGRIATIRTAPSRPAEQASPVTTGINPLLFEAPVTIPMVRSEVG
jgi:diguanylate cyclase